MKAYLQRARNAAVAGLGLLAVLTSTGCGTDNRVTVTPAPTRVESTVRPSPTNAVNTATPYTTPIATPLQTLTVQPTPTPIQVSTEKLRELLGTKRQTRDGSVPVAYLVDSLGDYNGDGIADFGLRYRDSASLTVAEILDGRTGQSIFRKNAQAIYDNSGFPREFDKITFRGSEVVRILGVMEEYTKNNPDKYGRKPSVFLSDGGVLSTFGTDSLRYSLKNKADLNGDGVPELGVVVSFSAHHNYNDRRRLWGESRDFVVFDGATYADLFRRVMRSDFLYLDRPAGDTFEREDFTFEDGKIKRTSIYRTDVTSQEKESCKSPAQPSASLYFTESYAWLKEDLKEGRFYDGFYKTGETSRRATFCGVPG